MRKLSVLLLKSGIRWKAVAPEEYALPIGEIAKGSTAYTENALLQPAFTDELLLMNEFTQSQLNAFLDALRRSRISISLKAVVTETNARWTSEELYRELCAERNALQTGTKAHT